MSLLPLLTVTGSPVAAVARPTTDVGYALPKVHGKRSDSIGIFIRATVTASTAGSFKAKLWLWHTATATWYPAGLGEVAADRGLLNLGKAIGEILDADNAIVHAETVHGLTYVDKIALELISPTNLTTLTAVADCRQGRS